MALLLLVGVSAAVWRFARAPEPPPARIDDAPPLFARSAAPAHPRIDDAAGILAPFGPRLGRMSDDFLADLGIEVHVVTLREKGSIEEQSERVFRERGIGADAPTGGLLVLLNPAVGQARIEVGYALEGGLTDLHMGRIARDQLAPYVSYASAGMAAMDVLHYLRDQAYLAVLAGDIALGEEFRRRPAYSNYRRFYSGGAGARTRLADLPIDADLKRPLSASERSRYAPSADVEESVAAFLRATVDLAGDPTLPLFTEGSRLMRAQYPLAPFEELKRLERVQASLPLKYRVQGDYAVATSERPVTGFVPVLLHREDGLWRVDLVETWKNLFFNPDGDYVLWNSNTSYRFGLGQFGEGRHHDIAPLPLAGRPLADELAQLQERGDVLSTLRQAELWLRNVFVFPRALSRYESALRAAPDDPLVLETLADRALYLGFPELAIPALEKAGPGFEMTLARAWNDMGAPREAAAWVERGLAADPHDRHALDWKLYLADRYGTVPERKFARAAIEAHATSAGKPGNPVLLAFQPERPRFHPESTIESGGVTVHDHSEFRVTMTNTSARPVVIDSVRLTSRGTAATSGLGDVKDYWRYPSGAHRLAPGESISFDKLWGFTVDTGHEHVRYTFTTCWHGEGETMRQCRVQWVDVMP
jgi:tetratricopeptide (TPR) repeat protein